MKALSGRESGEKINKKLIFIYGRYTALFSLLLFSFSLSAEESEALTEEPQSFWIIHLDEEKKKQIHINPVYTQISSAASNAGGNVNDYAGIRRIWTHHRAGADGSYRLKGFHSGFRISADARLSFNETAKRERYSEGDFLPSENFLFLRYMPDDTEKAAYPISSVPLYGSQEQRSMISARGGNMFVKTDPEGFLFSGLTNGGTASGRYRFASEECEQCSIKAGLYAFTANREKEIPDLPDGKARFTGGTLGISNRIFTLDISGLYYRFPGQPQHSGIVIPITPYYPYILLPSQTFMPDYKVYYYAIRTETNLKRFRSLVHIIYNQGKEERPTYATEPWPRPSWSIRGVLIYTALSYGLGKVKELPVCNPYSSAARYCSRETKKQYTHSGELSVLTTGQDIDDYDLKHQGYAGIRPAPEVMGGLSSILLSGPGIAEEQLPFSNLQPGTTQVHPPGLINSKNITDNRDPAYPDYSNDGFTVFSGAYMYLFRDFINEVRLNYGQLHKSKGTEMILRSSWTGLKEDASLQVFVSATGLRLKVDQESYIPELDVYVKRKPSVRYLSRYMAGITFVY